MKHKLLYPVFLGVIAIFALAACKNKAEYVNEYFLEAEIFAVDATTAHIGASADTDPTGFTITENGVVISATSVNSSPLIGGSGVTKIIQNTTINLDDLAMDRFRVIATGLTPGTEYSFAAYAITSNPVDTRYSPVSQFQTDSVSLPIAAAISPPAGSTDTGYTAGFTGNSVVKAMALQPDGKALIGGNFSNVGGAPHANLARLEADGSLDATYTASTDDEVRCLTTLADGKILICGKFTLVNGVARNNIARLNADGSVESTATFNPGTGAEKTGYASVSSIALQENGQILIAGEFDTVNGVARQNMARLKANGSLDGGFTADLGTGLVYAIAVQADENILIAGSFGMVNGTARNSIARLSPVNGSVDVTFDSGVGVDNPIVTMELQTDGKILIGGYFDLVGTETRHSFARLNADGSLDTGFNPGTAYLFWIYSMAVQEDGKTLVGGEDLNNANHPLDRLLNDPATHDVNIIDTTQAQWLRGGAGPEVSAVTFELSTDGGTIWTPLGNGTRITGGWEITGLNLPAGGSFRALGRTMNGNSGLMQQVRMFSFPPAVANPTSTGIKATGVTLGGNVTDDFGDPIIERGVVYSLTSANPNPLIGALGVTKVATSGTTGIFDLDVMDLPVATDYSFKAYATSSQGTGYTPVATFNTLDKPTVTPPTIANITATLSASLDSNGGSPITSYGFYRIQRSASIDYRLTDAVSLSLGTRYQIEEFSGSPTGDFQKELTNLDPDSRYETIAFARNAAGTTYSDMSRFDTLRITRSFSLPVASSVNAASSAIPVNATVNNLLGGARSMRITIRM